MDEDTHYNKGTGIKYYLGRGEELDDMMKFWFVLHCDFILVEDVVGSHVEDAVTFWAQVNRSVVDFSFLPSPF